MLATGRGDQRGADERDKGEKTGTRSGGKAGSKTGAGARFEVLGRAGEGTLWIAYRVRERATGQVLALKALKTVFNRHPRFPTALFSECQKWCSLEHPYLAAPREFGVEDNTLFSTSEWLPGGSLESRLNRPLSRDEIISVLRAATSALAFIHERGLTHGDVRPRQFLFDEEGHLKLTDGGVAGAFAAAGLALADVQPDAAWYLAPERTQGAALAPPADVYALGILLYRMLAGRVPFDGPSPLSIALRHRSDAPLPPSHFNPRCPTDLENLSLRLLEKDPERRPTALTLQNALQKLTGQASDAPVTPSVSATVAPPKATTPSVAPSAPNSAGDTIDIQAPRRRPISPIVEENLAAQKEQEVQFDRATLHKRHKRRELWGAFGAFIWLLVISSAFVGMFFGAYYFWVKDAPRPVRVPQYIGLDQEDAQAALAKSGLTMRVVRETYDAKKPEGTVVAGQPEPGRTVRSRREVSVTISQGEAPINMVDFTELPLSQARRIIAEHAMRLGPVVEQFHDKIPSGYICGQYPEAGQPFRRSEPITLIVSRGPQPTVIDGTTGDTGSADPSQPQATPTAASEPEATPGTDGVVSRTARITVQIPADGGTQKVQIIVRDADGERTVYSRSHHAGDTIQERVRVRRAQGATALVRVYVGQSLLKEEQL